MEINPLMWIFEELPDKLFFQNLLFLFHTRQKIARGILVLFTLMLLNGVVFRHAHRLPNGQIISHAHPYKPVGNSPIQPNNHTEHELFLLDAFANILFLTTAAFSFTFLVKQASGSKTVYFYILVSLFRFTRFYSLRGPPVVRF